MEQGAALLQWPGKRQPAEQRPTAAARLPACLPAFCPACCALTASACRCAALVLANTCCRSE
jgi:hypothetical protein